MYKCKGCGKEIIMLPTKNGIYMPTNWESVKELRHGLVFDTKEGHVSHFSDCARAGSFRKRRKK